MKKLLLFLFVTAFLGIQAQPVQQNVIISKATADWCPNCGTWGWSFFETLKEEFSNTSVTLLGVHHSGGLENPVSNWFANNLGNTYQPQFFVNNERFNVLASNWQQKVEEIKTTAENISNSSPTVNISFADTYIDANSNIHTSINVSPLNLPSADYYLGIYIFENDVIWYQSNQGSNAMHPNVLRDVMSDEYYGDSFAPGINTSGPILIEKSYKIENDNWIKDNIGLVAILWQKESNKYIYQNSEVIYNVGLLSDNENVLTESEFTIRNMPGYLVIEAPDSKQYQLIISNQLGQINYMNNFQGSANINTLYDTGIYIISIISDNNLISKKVLLSR